MGLLLALTVGASSRISISFLILSVNKLCQQSRLIFGSGSVEPSLQMSDQLTFHVRVKMINMIRWLYDLKVITTDTANV